MDSVELSTFRWMVPQAGFEWKKESKTGDLWLYEKSTGKTGSGEELIQLVETDPARKDPMLHRAFGDLHSGSDEAILDFASRHGRLGMPRPVDLQGVGETYAEPLSIWRTLAKSMLVLIEAIDDLDRQPLRVLNFRIRLLGVIQGLIDDSERRPTLGFASRAEFIAPDTFTRRVDAAKHMRAMIARNIAVNLSPHVHMVTADRKSSIEFRAKPSNLLGFMWAAFAVEVEGHGEARECLTCGQRFFVTAALGVRSNRRFCSNACKSAIYRKRRAEALKLAAQGKTAKQVAKALSLEGSTVSVDAAKRWMGKP